MCVCVFVDLFCAPGATTSPSDIPVKDVWGDLPSACDIPRTLELIVPKSRERGNQNLHFDEAFKGKKKKSNPICPQMRYLKSGGRVKYTCDAARKEEPLAGMTFSSRAAAGRSSSPRTEESRGQEEQWRAKRPAEVRPLDRDTPLWWHTVISQLSSLLPAQYALQQLAFSLR